MTLELVPGPLVLACPDWETRLRQGRSLVPDGARGINDKEAARAIAIFDRLRLPDVVGLPLLAEAAGDWFREIVGTLLGAIDAATGERLIRELFLLAPKKSAKTSYGAAMMLTALLMNKRPRAEFLLIGCRHLCLAGQRLEAGGGSSKNRSSRAAS